MVAIDLIHLNLASLRFVLLLLSERGCLNGAEMTHSGSGDDLFLGRRNGISICEHN